MILRLTQLPDTLRGPAGPDYKGMVPKRARFLEPGAAASLLSLIAKWPWLAFTDVYRSPEGSLAAMRSKRGVQPPGFSAHNFGVAVDLDLETCQRAGKLKYVELVQLMRDAGWHCHRRDLDQTASEAWHFNYLGDRTDALLLLADLDNHSTWSAPVEARIQELYGNNFSYDDVTLQTYLKALKLYSGDLDGKIGPLAQEAIRVFQRAWNLAPDGAAGPRTKRVLAVVSATIQMVS